MAEVPAQHVAVERVHDHGSPPWAGEERSDHYSFQVNGFPACLASEDFFLGPGPDDPAPDANPNYHSSSDTTIADTYVRDIDRAVTTAAWISGTR